MARRSYPTCSFDSGQQEVVRMHTRKNGLKQTVHEKNKRRKISCEQAEKSAIDKMDPYCFSTSLFSVWLTPQLASLKEDPFGKSAGYASMKQLIKFYIYLATP